MNRRSRRLSELNNRVDEAADVRDETWNTARSAEQDVDQLRDDLDDLRSGVSSLVDRVDGVETEIKAERKERERAVQRLGDWAEDRLRDVRQAAHAAREEVRT